MEAKPLGLPQMRAVTWDMLGTALRNGWHDMRRAPGYGLVFAGVYVMLGWGMVWITWVTGQSYWLVFAAVGFPLIGPFAAVGLYEISHRLDQGQELTPGEIFTVILHQRRRQLPSLCAIILIIFLFWFFLAHMIFALFLGFSEMVNISESYDVLWTPNGLGMLAFGTCVGAGVALLLFMLTVLSLPLLLDREVDFVTAMITSFQAVLTSPLPMLGWGVFVAGLSFLAMLPGFVGLFVVLPLLGHATWHLYRQVCDTE